MRSDSKKKERMKVRASSLAAVLFTALAVVPSASAHAILVSSTPANDAIVDKAPKSVVLRFNEPVESAFGSVRVYNSQAKRVDNDRAARPDEKTVEVRIGRRLADGTYTATWRVVSADSHPVSGAFVFHVGAPGANSGGVAAEVLGGGTPRSVDVLFTIVRFFDFALLLLVIGGAVALAYPLRSAASPLRARLLTVLGVWAGLLAVIALAGIVLQGAKGGGFGLSEAATWTSFRSVLDTRFGKVWLLQAALAAAVGALAFVATRRPGGRVATLLVAPALALAVTPSLSGHASVRGGLTLVADLAHVAAGAVWTGGLAFVVIALLAAGSDRWPLGSRAVPLFSRLAVLSVAVLLVAGTFNAYEEVGSWHGLWDTTYGLLLLAKIALVLPVLALGAYNNRFAVPRLRNAVASVADRRRFLQMAGAELAIVVAIVGVTSVLVTEPPARASVAPSGPYATTVALGGLEANVVADPAKTGLNIIHVYLTDRSGQPADVAELDLSASLPSENLGPLRFPAHPLAPGHYAVHGAQLALAGDWQLRIEARRGEFEALTTTVSIPIRKGP
jgi:copper transport protein